MAKYHLVLEIQLAKYTTKEDLHLNDRGIGSWRSYSAYIGENSRGKWENGHGHGRSPTGIVVLDGKTQLLELHDFLPFAHNDSTYKTGHRGTGKFLSSPPTPVGSMSFEWELEVE